MQVAQSNGTLACNLVISNVELIVDPIDDVLLRRLDSPTLAYSYLRTVQYIDACMYDVDHRVNQRERSKTSQLISVPEFREPASSQNIPIQKDVLLFHSLFSITLFL